MVRWATYDEQSSTRTTTPRARQGGRGVKERFGGEVNECGGEIRPPMDPAPSPGHLKREDGFDRRDHCHGGKNASDGSHAGRELGHCITSWSGTSFAGSRTPRMATTRPARVSTWTVANT